MLQRRCLQTLSKQIRSVSWQERRARANEIRSVVEMSNSEVNRKRHEQLKLIKMQEQQEQSSANVVEGKWQPEKIIIPKSELTQRRNLSTFKSEIPPASPGGRGIAAEIKRIIIPQMYQLLLLDPESCLIPCVLSISNHPKLSYAFSRARISPHTDKFSIAFWKFQSAPRTIYALWTTHDKGILHKLKDFTEGIMLSSLQIVHGPSLDVKHLTDAPTELGSLSQYCYINRHCRVSPGPLLDSFKDFSADSVDAYELPSAVPPASYASEVFDWGYETDAYVAPVDAKKSNSKEEDVIQKHGGGHYKVGHILQSMHRESTELSTELEESRLRGAGSRLYYRNPKRASEALKTIGENQQKLIDKITNKNQVTTDSAFDTI